MLVTLGSDVEVAVHKEGTPVDVTGMLGGSKDEPVWFDNFNIQEDNVNAEYAINPVSSLDDWILYHNQAISKVSDLLPEGHGILFNASTEYTDDHVRSDNAKVFGCDPDYSAWSGQANRTPNISKVGNLRTCGGHIHVGIEGVDIHDLVKCMDVFLGLPSLFKDTDTKRRQVYGKAGAHRPKPYGVEYRSLSNFWAKDREGMVWAYNQTLKAIEFCKADMLPSIPNITNIPRSIDTNDMQVADTTLNWLINEGIC